MDDHKETAKERKRRLDKERQARKRARDREKENEVKTQGEERVVNEVEQERE
jgi:hypothetical protein